ncbi:CinA-like protein [Tenuifilaceae bacterium CYCD]|nr:CinA-like protein [Tenuifilaceae bacterium CYCD]
MNAEIITIGDEILIGQIVDTNSAWIAQQLNLLGVKITQITSISDTEEAIYSSVNQSINRCDIVIMTGGLGPTSDDITKPTLCKFFGGSLVLHEPSLEIIKSIFGKRGLQVTESNRKQAEVPSSCEVLLNHNGTAPGMLFRKDGKMLVSMPGVPFEMKGLMEGSVIPLLKQRPIDQTIIHKTVYTFGIPESFLSDKLQVFESKLPNYIKLAYLPSPSGIRLRLSGYSFDYSSLNSEIGKLVEYLRKEIPEYIFGYGETSLSAVVGQMLKSVDATVSTAESCTGGMIAHLITEIPGSSSYFKGSVVAYSNEVKTSVLNVDVNALNENGAVSQQVVEQMAVGVRELLKTDYSIAISGIAGPDGGTEFKPVGTVWIAVSSNRNLISKKYIFSNQRDINILRASNTALNLLRELMLQEHLELNENIFGEKFE